MEIVGMLDSPFVRRVAISARCLEIPYEHRALSIFKRYDEFRELNPLVKVPTLVCDDGEMLVDSTLIIDHLQRLCANGRSLMPEDVNGQRSALQLIGVALVAMEKLAQVIYETRQRPEELIHQPWLDRLLQQLSAALEQLEAAVGSGDSWLVGDALMQPDISIAVAWRFSQYMAAKRVNADDYPGLVRFSERAEALAEFKACPLT